MSLKLEKERGQGNGEGNLHRAGGPGGNGDDNNGSIMIIQNHFPRLYYQL